MALRVFLKKNLRDFHGKSLLEITVEHAMNSTKIGRIIVSSDSEEINNKAKEYNAEVPFIRPDYLSESHIHSTDVIIHCLNWLEVKEKYYPEFVVMLLPTSPLRTVEDVDNCISILLEKKYDSVVSVCDLGKNINNLRFLNQNKIIYPFKNVDLKEQRQSQKKLYGVNGSIFMSKTSTFLETKSFHQKNTYGYEMELLKSVDINTESDFVLASNIYENILIKNNLK